MEKHPILSRENPLLLDGIGGIRKVEVQERVMVPVEPRAEVVELVPKLEEKKRIELAKKIENIQALISYFADKLNDVEARVKARKLSGDIVNAFRGHIRIFHADYSSYKAQVEGRETPRISLLLLEHFRKEASMLASQIDDPQRSGTVQGYLDTFNSLKSRFEGVQSQVRSALKILEEHDKELSAEAAEKQAA